MGDPNDDPGCPRLPRPFCHTELVCVSLPHCQLCCTRRLSVDKMSSYVPYLQGLHQRLGRVPIRGWVASAHRRAHEADPCVWEVIEIGRSWRQRLANPSGWILGASCRAGAASWQCACIRRSNNDPNAFGQHVRASFQPSCDGYSLQV